VSITLRADTLRLVANAQAEDPVSLQPLWDHMEGCVSDGFCGFCTGQLEPDDPRPGFPEAGSARFARCLECRTRLVWFPEDQPDLSGQPEGWRALWLMSIITQLLALSPGGPE
jgi:hypothetical protein